jgi:hypothetical protein
MLRKLSVGTFLILAIFCLSTFAQQKTVIRDAKAKAMLLGKHRLSLQWISWDYFGAATVTERNGRLSIVGRQDGRGRSRGDYLTINGVITSISAREFKFDGKIVMRISHINNGEPCAREGEMTFRITGNRRYWRLQEMDNPCDSVTDYVDIFFR